MTKRTNEDRLEWMEQVFEENFVIQNEEYIPPTPDPVEEENRREGYVYMVQDSSCGYCKIGVTMGDPNRRISLLQTGNPNELILISLIRTKNPYVLEKYFHHKFNEKRLRNEWFDLGEEEIAEFDLYE